MMTYRDFYEAVRTAMADNAEVIEFVNDKLAKLNKRSDESSEKRDKIFGALTTTPQTAQEIADLVGISRQSVSSNMTVMIKAGKPIVKEDGLNSDGKVCKTYRIKEEE